MILLSEIRLLQKQYILKALPVKAVNGQDERRIEVLPKSWTKVMRQSIDYLMMLAHSLVAQGFRKIFFVDGHGPSSLYIDAMCRDFFQETKVHVCHLNGMALMANFHVSAGGNFMDLDKLACGAYKLLHQEDYLPVDPDAEDPKDSGFGTPPSPEQKELSGSAAKHSVLAPL